MIQLTCEPVRRRTVPRTWRPSPCEATARQRLQDSGYVALRKIACRCRIDTAVLTGQVPSFYLKQVAQTIVGKIEGVRQVDNRLEVVDRPDGFEF